MKRNLGRSEAAKVEDGGRCNFLALRLLVLFDLILYVPVTNLSVMSGQVFLCGTSTKLGLMCLAQGHYAVMPVRLEPVALRSRVKHSTTESLCSHPVAQW